MTGFVPKRVYYEPGVLSYPLGKKLVDHFRKENVPVTPTGSHNRVTGIPGKTAVEKYREAKQTLVLGVRKSEKFQSCKPSAHYQLPLVTSCPGMCEYCYLATTLGPKPYVRVYVNIGEILELAQDHIKERLPEETVFEGAATSDPIPVERYTGSLKKTIEFFGKQEYARFRFVTKFTEVDSLLDANHNNKTRFRFSLNCDKVISRFEHGTPPAIERIKAAGKVLKSAYPLGFIIAPIIRFEGWQDEYTNMFESLRKELELNAPQSWTPKQLTLEFISHRFTPKAKKQILGIYPATTLPMIEEERKYKYGQFGYGKYIYQPDEMVELKEFFLKSGETFFPEAKVEYFI